MLNPEDVLYLVSSDLSEVKCFYGSFSDAGQKVPLPFKSSKRPASYNVEKIFSLKRIWTIF